MCPCVFGIVARWFVHLHQVIDPEFVSSYSLFWPVLVAYHAALLSARRGSQALQALSSQQRADILHTLAALLVEREADIMTANERDLEAATELSPPLQSRLTLSSKMLASLAEGLHQLAGMSLRLQLFIDEL